jgi:uncharacterized protein YqiB (DUF1249 family)
MIGFGVEGKFPENECHLLHLDFYTFLVQVWQTTTNNIILFENPSLEEKKYHDANLHMMDTSKY